MPISFSHQVKMDIVENRLLRARYKPALAYGLFLFGRSFTEAEISLRTEHQPTAGLYASLLRDFAGKKAEADFQERTRGEKTVCTVRLTGPAERQSLLRHFGQTDGINMEKLPSPETLQAFFAGAFLACGNITNPQKSYHMEFVVGQEALCAQLYELLAEHIHPPKRTVRRGSPVIYYKESAHIEDLMTAMGASKSCLALIEVEIVKTVRNKANRVTNCETANIDKTVSAAAIQIEDIALVLSHCEKDTLPPGLWEAAQMRLQNPDMSLRELAEAMPGSISRSGVHHRLDKLSKIATQIRQSKGENRNV